MFFKQYIGQVISSPHFLSVEHLEDILKYQLNTTLIMKLIIFKFKRTRTG